VKNAPVILAEHTLADAVPGASRPFLQDDHVAGLRERRPGRQQVHAGPPARGQAEMHGR